MGKIKSRKLKARHRLQPTGLPSVREAEQQQALEGPGPESSADLPLLEKLSSPSAGDREWACCSLSHLVVDLPTAQQLVAHQTVRRVALLLVDQAPSVREAAAGALRNFSLSNSGEFCEQMVQEDIMSPLSAMLKECVTRLQQLQSEASMDTEDGTSTEGAKSGLSPKTMRQQLTNIAEQGVHLLWNLSENSPVVVEVFNREGLLPVILHFLQPDTYPSSLVVAAAQCLHTLTEDNMAAIQLLCSSPDHLSLLERNLMHSMASDASPTGWTLLLRTSIAGVFQNQLCALSEPLFSQTLRGVLSVLAAVLDTDVSSLLHTLSTTPPPTPPQEEGQLSGSNPQTKETTSDTSKESEGNSLLQHLGSVLSAQRLALEILTNISYTESEEEEEERGEWEDEEEEEVIGGDALMEAESSAQQRSQTEITPALSLVVEFGLHEKVWKKCCCVDATLYQTCSTIEGGNCIAQRLNAVQGRSLLALQNLLSALPVEGWGGGGNLATIWGSLFTLLEVGGQFLHPDALMGALMVLADKLNSINVDCITQEQLQLVSQVGMSVGDPSVRADAMALLGTAGKMVLRKQPLDLSILTVMGTPLRDCISKDPSLWVVSQALDAVFDVFGDDNCPPGVFSGLGFLPVLKNTASIFKARLRVEKKSLGPQLGLVQNTKLNLPRFIEYMSTRTKT